MYQYKPIALCLLAVMLIFSSAIGASAMPQFTNNSGSFTSPISGKMPIVEVESHQNMAPDSHNGHQEMTDEEMAEMPNSGSASGSESGHQEIAAAKKQSWIPYANVISILLVAAFLLFRGKRQLGTRGKTEEIEREAK